MARSMQKTMDICDLTDSQFKSLAAIIYDNFGINLPLSKKELIPRRLNKRVKHLGLTDYGQYISYVKNNWSQEKQILANAITTNLTSFFREAHHFEYLEQQIIPALLKKNRLSKKIRLWSAACSTGEEPYSIAMVLTRFERELKGWDVKVLATDLDTNILSTAVNASYRHDQLDKVPPDFVRRFFMPSDNDDSLYNLDPCLKERVFFKRLNFFETWPVKGFFDVIFCRNALIYFDLTTQKKVLSGFSRCQNTSQYLLVGHSESLLDVTNEYDLIGQTIYRKNR